MRQGINEFLSSKKQYPFLTIFVAGLYPFLHYFNSNLHISNTWKQVLYVSIISFVLPCALLIVSRYVVKLKPIKRFERYRLAFLNLATLLVLIGFLVFNFKKKATVLMIIIAFVLALFLYKHIKKIVVLQILISLMSLVTLVPVVYFAINQDNDEWASVSDDMLKTKLELTPNIFVIQPDGYVNRSEINKSPYLYDNSSFDSYLAEMGFDYYDHFRSNYYSTTTSNSSMFAMQHNYYSNTFHKSLKTFNSNEAIVGKHNNVLNILNQNEYRTHLFTDNSFFLVDRKPMVFDYCNVEYSKVSWVDCGPVHADIIEDFNATMDTLNTNKNFFFIEKTIPGHISYYKRNSLGKEGERLRYLERLEDTNEWLKTLINRINEFDENALIIIVADHGGFVGLDYTLEATERPMNELETISTFSSMLAIKWPSQLANNTLEFKSTVNLFRTVFYGLSRQDEFKITLPNTSYIPMYENGKAEFYECINANGNVVFKRFDTP